MAPRRLAAVAIPAFNAAHTIAETLQALQACSRLSEIGGTFVFDDGSSDATAQAARDSWTSASPFTVVSGRKGGQWPTLNAAMAHLRDKFEWILVLHADDVVKPEWLDLYLDRMSSAGPKVASICSSYDRWDPVAGTTEPGDDDPARPIEVVQGTPASVRGTINRGCWWHISGCAIRSDAFQAIGEFDPAYSYSGDFEWLLRCHKRGFAIEYIPRSTMLYRVHAATVSSAAFLRGQDLIERLRLCQIYQRQGDVDATEARTVRRRIARFALARLLKSVAHANLRQALTFASISWDALADAR